jgi:hypothetical protein
MAVKCPYCGTINLETAVFCASCGHEIVLSTSQSAQPSSRNCTSCGRSIPWGALVCPYCGKDYRALAFPPEQKELVSTGMRVLLYIVSFLIPIAGFIIGAIYYTKPEQEYKHVGKICIVLGLVAFLVSFGFAALLYLMVLGFGGTDGAPAIQVLNRSSVPGGFKIAFTSPTSEVVWSDVMMTLSDGWETVSWHPTTQELTSTYPPTTWRFGSGQQMGAIDVWLNVTDLAANGRVGNGDYITLTTSGGQFSMSTTYTLTLIYEPTGSAMVNYNFTG